MSEVIADAADDGNAPDEVNPAPTILNAITSFIADPTATEVSTVVSDAAEAPTEEAVEELSAAELPVPELLVKELPGAIFPANNAGNFSQRRIPIRYAINDNPDRGSRNLPQPKHLVIKLPDAVAQLFSAAWVAEKDGEVFIDFFARNDQDDARRGRKVDDPWRWIKIKTNGEIAVGISRPYTKSMSEGELVRDYNFGAFKLAVPLGECVAEDQPTSRRLFG